MSFTSRRSTKDSNPFVQDRAQHRNPPHKLSPAISLTAESIATVAITHMSAESAEANTLVSNATNAIKTTSLPAPQIPHNQSQETQIQNNQVRNSQTTLLPTPVKWDVLQFFLEGYDSDKTEYLVNGFRNGFQLHYEGERDFQESPNLKSAVDNPEIVGHKLQKELALGRIAGPFFSHHLQT